MKKKLITIGSILLLGGSICAGICLSAAAKEKGFVCPIDGKILPCELCCPLKN